jgi:hypothetical protein
MLSGGYHSSGLKAWLFGIHNLKRSAGSWGGMAWHCSKTHEAFGVSLGSVANGETQPRTVWSLPVMNCHERESDRSYYACSAEVTATGVMAE